MVSFILSLALSAPFKHQEKHIPRGNSLGSTGPIPNPVSVDRITLILQYKTCSTRTFIIT